MRERFTEIWASIKALWDRTSKKAKIILFSCLAGALVLILALILVFGRTNYALLYNGLSVQEGANVLAILGEMGIEPQVSTTGAIYVPETDVNRARMQVATNGFTGGNFTSYDVYKEAGITSTQAERDQWYVNQTQNRLQDTIQTFEEVQQAVVNISIPQRSIYALQGDNLPPTASVKITKRAGRTLTPEQIQGIINIVKDSVAGLTEDNISISDETGDIKSYIENQRGSTSKLSLTEQVNQSVRAKIMNMLYPVFGADNVQVAVNSVLDTDSKITERNEYIPFDENDPQNNPLDSAIYDKEKIGGAAGPAEGVPGANDNVDVPQYSARDVDVTDADSFAVHDELDYLVSSVREQVIKEGFEIRDMNVAVLVNSTNMPDSQRDQIIDIVSTASGVANDKVSVQNMQFRGLPAVNLEPTQPDMTQYLIIGAAAAAAFFTILIIIIMSVRKKRMEERLAAEAAMADADLADLMDEGNEFEPIQLQETQEQKLKLQIRDLAMSDPEIVAQLLKTWLVHAD